MPQYLVLQSQQTHWQCAASLQSHRHTIFSVNNKKRCNGTAAYINASGHYSK